MANNSAFELFGGRTVRMPNNEEERRVMEAEAMPLAPDVASELMKISRTLTFRGRSSSANGKNRIGPTQERILAFLLNRSPAPTTLSGLAAGISLSHATASEAVRALQTRGLVRKARSRNDARVVNLSLSSAGRRKAEQSAAGNSHLRAAIGRLPRSEQALVLHTLKNIQQAITPGLERGRRR